jgi:class 3 adenylate cyclase
MDSVPPYPIGPGKRVLAAIVFTDVVSFSRRMHREEVPTLELLEQDFEVMRKLAEKHAGAVLKTTGDGLLIHFGSAVQAVGYALVLQRQFARRSRAHPGEATLTHRVGIHLGDVFMKDQDVMGDGVNTAARLQAEADPGGICISQTVHDVVKNKIELQVVRVPPRGPKSIAEAVTIYRVILEAGTLQPVPPVPAYQPPAPPPPAPPSSGPKVAGVFLVIALVAAGAVLVWRWQEKHGEELARSRTTQTELDVLLAAKARERAPEQSAGQAPGPATAPEKQFEQLLAWVGATLPRYTRDRPLRLRELSGAPSGDTKLFVDADHRLYFAQGGAVRPRELTELKPDALGAVIVSVLLDGPQPPPAEFIAGAQAYARAHGLSDMGKALGASDRP